MCAFYNTGLHSVPFHFQKTSREHIQQIRGEQRASRGPRHSHQHDDVRVRALQGARCHHVRFLRHGQERTDEHLGVRTFLQDSRRQVLLIMILRLDFKTRVMMICYRHYNRNVHKKSIYFLKMIFNLLWVLKILKSIDID